MSVDADLFAGPKAKLERAEHHISDLESRIKDFLAAGKHRIVGEVDTKTRQRIIRVKEDEPIPQPWALILGDAIHNLRSALDILACDAVRAKGKSIDKVYFPFAIDKDCLEDALNEGNIRKAGPEVLAEIRALKPYRDGDGNKLLRGLHDLDIADKHRLLLPVSTAGHIEHVGFPGGGSITGPTFVGTKNLVSMPARFPNRKMRRATGWVPKEEKVDASVKIIFGKGKAFSVKEILPTLREIASEVEKAIGNIKAAALA